MKRLTGSVFSILLLIWGCTALEKDVIRDSEGDHITILFSHFISGYLEPCG